MNTPQDIYQYIVDQDKISSFLSAIMLQKQGYSIAEIPDCMFTMKEDGCYFESKMYHLDLMVEDDDILTAVLNGLYISAFISRKDDLYRVHFLRHPYPKHMKSQFEEAIAEEVVRYMVLNTIVALRLDTWKKVDRYLA